VRINHRIKVSPVRLIDENGGQVGIIPTPEALDRAREAGLDLVEISPDAKPPVCRIMDYGKFKYEQSKKDKMAKKKQHTTQIKEMRYRPKIDEHDYKFKTKHVREFLESGSKVKAFVFFRGREMAHQELGQEVLDRLAAEMEDIATIDMKPIMEGRKMNMILAPRAEIVKQVHAAKADALAKKRSDKEKEHEKTVEETETVSQENQD
jgi:translation initiation factor IF-3